MLEYLEDIIGTTKYVEKIEELKNYSLFDFVSPLLSSDPDNLLAIQNQIQENRRYYNTYSNPIPEPRMPSIPKTIATWNQPMINTYPTKYPFKLDMPASNNYYDHFSDDKKQFLEGKLNYASQGHLLDPDLEALTNAQRDNFTATDKRVMPHGSNVKPSLVEGLNPSALTQTDLMYFV